jgi:hypothetical protein
MRNARPPASLARPSARRGVRGERREDCSGRTLKKSVIDGRRVDHHACGSVPHQCPGRGVEDIDGESPFGDIFAFTRFEARGLSATRQRDKKDRRNGRLRRPAPIWTLRSLGPSCRRVYPLLTRILVAMTPARRTTSSARPEPV